MSWSVWARALVEETDSQVIAVVCFVLVVDLEDQRCLVVHASLFAEVCPMRRKRDRVVEKKHSGGSFGHLRRKEGHPSMSSHNFCD